ncbi:hypothetical protein BRC86_09240 [Halobacteriales archaeon QS_3_64_16]|nr:MAG: hypothetical protein BRC86_09240 [Halobacteriales archaeon QS_3_64_16]
MRSVAGQEDIRAGGGIERQSVRFYDPVVLIYRMVRWSGLAVGVVLLAVLGAAVSGPAIDGVGSTDGGEATAQRASGIVAAQGFDSTEFEVLVYPNGSARWTFTYKRALANESERSNFEDYAARFNSQEVRLYEEFVRLAQRLVRVGAETTGRKMEARAFDREARVGSLNNQGVVEMSFLWSGFALVQEDGTVMAGDVFDGGAFEGGLYVGPNEQFSIRAGGDLVFRSVEPDPDSMSAESMEASETVSWTGEREFDNGRPNAVLGPPSTSSESLPVAVGGAVLLLLGLAAAIAWRFGGVPGSGRGSRSGSGPGSTPIPGAGSGTGSEPTGSGAGSEGSKTPEPAVSDEELLADDDRVLRLLEANGGRMRQVAIVEETDWSKSKVSMLLSEMEGENRISKLRIGRENIVSLRGEEPDTNGPSSEEQ